jgi:hypothetical protein
VAPGNLNFKIEGNMLVTADGTEIVRYIYIGKKVMVLRKSCFSLCRDLEQISFEHGSELERRADFPCQGFRRPSTLLKRVPSKGALNLNLA